VQETFVDAHRDFEQFVGKSEGELFAWLRQILLHKASHARDRYFGTAKRNLAQEQPLFGSSNVAGPGPTPSRLAVGAENRRQLADALERLPADHRQVIELRSFERLPFAEVGQRMERGEDAVGKLWFRAIEKLRELMVESDAAGHDFSP
jgi:RNA polymerase sigma-70 factor (ECF subfamily)